MTVKFLLVLVMITLGTVTSQTDSEQTVPQISNFFEHYLKVLILTVQGLTVQGLTYALGERISRS